MSFKRKVRRNQVENFFILSGVLYKMNGKPVTVDEKDEKYRNAYHKLIDKMGRFCPDGFYVFYRNQFKPLPFHGTEQDLQITLNALGDSLGIPK